MTDLPKPGLLTVTFNIEPAVETPLEREHCLAEALLMAEGWGKVANRFAKSRPFPNEAREFYHQFWTTSGFNIRRKVDDDILLAEMLRKMLPPYSGCSMQLFRGEGGNNWDLNKIGFCWSSDINIAKKFACGVNCDNGSGGILLSCFVSAEAIISGPSAHSHHLGESEYTVDPHMLTDILALERITWDQMGNQMIVHSFIQAATKE